MNISNIFIKTSIAAAVAAATIATADACTNFVAGKNATADGSTMVTYAADSHTLYGFLQHLPAADHPEGALREVREWDTGKPLGHIPEVRHTYSVIGNMNEHQLTIAESTWGGRPELVDTTGIIDYGSLINIALQRCKTAREAIATMTALVQEHGYYSSGESFSIADPDEVWIMDLIGKGADEKGAVWVAVRIPDDCIAGHANNPRIHRFPLNDKENCIYSSDVISFARKKGYFSGRDEDFDFARAAAEPEYRGRLQLLLRGCYGILEEFRMTLRFPVRIDFAAGEDGAQYVRLLRELLYPRLELALEVDPAALPPGGRVPAPLRFHGNYWRLRCGERIEFGAFRAFTADLPECFPVPRRVVCALAGPPDEARLRELVAGLRGETITTQRELFPVQEMI